MPERIGSWHLRGRSPPYFVLTSFPSCFFHHPLFFSLHILIKEARCSGIIPPQWIGPTLSCLSFAESISACCWCSGCCSWFYCCCSGYSCTFCCIWGFSSGDFSHCSFNRSCFGFGFSAFLCETSAVLHFCMSSAGEEGQLNFLPFSQFCSIRQWGSSQSLLHHWFIPLMLVLLQLMLVASGCTLGTSFPFAPRQNVYTLDVNVEIILLAMDCRASWMVINSFPWL